MKNGLYFQHSQLCICEQIDVSCCERKKHWSFFNKMLIEILTLYSFYFFLPSKHLLESLFSWNHFVCSFIPLMISFTSYVLVFSKSYFFLTLNFQVPTLLLFFFYFFFWIDFTLSLFIALTRLPPSNGGPMVQSLSSFYHIFHF